MVCMWVKLLFKNKIEADEPRFIISVCAHAVPYQPNPCKQRTHAKKPTNKQPQKQSNQTFDRQPWQEKKKYTYAIMINKNCRGGGLWNMGAGVDESASGLSRSRIGSPLTSIVSSASWKSWS